MKKDDTFKFLVRTAIPKVKDDKRPLCLNGQSEDEELIWDAIYRAHRDVLTGQRNVKYYYSVKNDRGINAIAESLYFRIIEKHGKEHLQPRQLIGDLCEEFGPRGVKLGAIQKLVNMTLKYILILQIFDVLKTELVEENDLDCPVDSVIIDRISETGDGEKSWTLWTQLTDIGEYERIQKSIQNKERGLSRIGFDFKYWQELKHSDG